MRFVHLRAYERRGRHDHKYCFEREAKTGTREMFMAFADVPANWADELEQLAESTKLVSEHVTLLKKLLAERAWDRFTLGLLRVELNHRGTERAKQALREVEGLLSGKVPMPSMWATNSSVPESGFLSLIWRARLGREMWMRSSWAKRFSRLTP